MLTGALVYLTLSIAGTLWALSLINRGKARDNHA